MILNWIWMLPLNDEALDALVARSQGGNIEALQELQDMFRARTRELAASFMGNEELVPGIVQAVFRRVYEAARQHKLRKNFALWLYLQILDVMLDTSRSNLLSSKAGAGFHTPIALLNGKVHPLSELFV